MTDTDFERAMQANAAPLDEYLAGLIAKASPQWRVLTLMSSWIWLEVGNQKQ